MVVNGAQVGVPCSSVSSTCIDKFGCPSNVSPDFIIKRHDTKPPFKVSVEDCDGVLDLSEDDLVLETNMWAKGKLKTAITTISTYFALADNIGWEQAMVGDIIVMDRVRRPEHMLVIGFDEINCLIQVQRAYNGTVASSWKKGHALRIFRIMDGPSEIEIIRGDVVQDDGTTLEDQVIESRLIYEWDANSTCLPGCYWLEFKLLKMEAPAVVSMLSVTTGASIIPSFTPSTFTDSDFGCILGVGVEWARRFPACGEGFLIKIDSSPTTELA